MDVVSFVQVAEIDPMTPMAIPFSREGVVDAVFSVVEGIGVGDSMGDVFIGGESISCVGVGDSMGDMFMEGSISCVSVGGLIEGVCIGGIS